MNLTVPTTFTSSYLAQLQQLNLEQQNQAKIIEIYGSFQHGAFNSARPAKYLPKISRQQFCDHVKEAAGHDINFNYLINAPCYANQEYSSEGRHKLEELLGFLLEAKVASVTVTAPFLVAIIARCFPQLEIKVSTIAYVDTLRGIEQFAKAGANRIVLNVDANRDFSFLEQAVKQSPIPLEIIANPVCLYQCQYKHNHYEVAGQGKPYNQFYLNWCFLEKMTTPGEFLRSPWLRPEDLGLWQNVGIDFFKLAGRGQDEKSLISLCKAYMTGQFQGNLLELMGWPHWQIFNKSPDGKILPNLEIKLNNSSLPGFLDYFAKNRPNCRLGCHNCGHCDRWAAKALKLSDQSLNKKYIANMTKSLTNLVEHIPSLEESTLMTEKWLTAADKQRLPE